MTIFGSYSSRDRWMETQTWPDGVAYRCWPWIDGTFCLLHPFVQWAQGIKKDTTKLGTQQRAVEEQQQATSLDLIVVLCVLLAVLDCHINLPGLAEGRSGVLSGVLITNKLNLLQVILPNPRNLRCDSPHPPLLLKTTAHSAASSGSRLSCNWWLIAFHILLLKALQSHARDIRHWVPIMVAGMEKKAISSSWMYDWWIL